jgi:hypothetical protein
MQRCTAAFLPLAALAVVAEETMTKPAPATTSTTRQTSAMRM